MRSRAKEDMNPTEGGDTHMVPTNTISLDRFPAFSDKLASGGAWTTPQATANAKRGLALNKEVNGKCATGVGRLKPHGSCPTASPFRTTV